MGLKILFRGSYSDQGSDLELNIKINEYAKQLAKSIINQNHKLIFSGTRDLDMFVAKSIFENLAHDEDKIRDNVEFILPENLDNIPEFGVVQRYKVPEYWSSARTYQVTLCDAIISIGGKKGTADCIEKAVLCKKPVFPVWNINGYPREVWEKTYYRENYYYISPKDAEFIIDENLPPTKFFDITFNILNLFENGRVKNFFDREKQKSVIETWRHLVKEGKLEKALNNTLKVSDRIDSGLENQLIILLGQYNSIKKQQNLGLPEKNTELNRIALSYLDIVDELEKTI